MFYSLFRAEEKFLSFGKKEDQMSVHVGVIGSGVVDEDGYKACQVEIGHDTHKKKCRRVEPEELYLIFLDTETSGLSPDTSHMLEIAFKVVNALTGEEKGFFESVVKLTETDFEYWKNKPDEWVHEHAKALEINGFTWKKMAAGSSPSQVAERICTIFQQLGVNKNNAQFYCQNPSFDRGFFEKIVVEKQRREAEIPYHWFDLASADHAFQMHRIGKSGKRPTKRIRYSKDAIAERHKLPAEAKPHGAMNGVNHLIECYKKVVGFPLRNC